jgi:hypothetical protein
MAEASEAMEFERAAALRDRIRALTNVQSSQGINPRGVREADVIALHMEGGQACVQVFFIRANQNWGNKDYYPRVGPDIEAPEVLEAFIGQFYDQKDPPRQLILSHPIDNDDLMADALSQKLGRKVEILVPQRGEKAELVNGALRNARESLARQMAEGQAQTKLLARAGRGFRPRRARRSRIEVYDNSHIQGTNAVGAMIVSGPEGFVKSQYRKFNIRGDDLTPGDDFGMMKEVLTRRFQRLLKEDPDRESEAWPDLLLIDGGAGQVSAVKEIMDDLGVEDVPFIGVAKGIDRDQGKEEFHRPGQSAFALNRNDPVLYFVQRMRDEAHRFAIRCAPAETRQGGFGDAARRYSRRRRDEKARTSDPFRQCESRQSREPRRPQGGGGRERGVGAEDLRLFPRAGMTVRSAVFRTLDPLLASLRLPRALHRPHAVERAQYLTVLRLLAAPMLGIVFLILPRPAADWVALFLFIFASLTDYVDGWLARKWGQISRFGAMLDPIADKAMVVIALGGAAGAARDLGLDADPGGGDPVSGGLRLGPAGIPGRNGRIC